MKRAILDDMMSRKKAALIVALAIICYVILNVSVGLRKHELFHSYAWDLGVFTQAFDSTLHGTGFFTYSVEPFTNPSGTFFGVHFSPILLAILPFYALYPSVATLLVAQAFALALGAVPIYLLSMSVLNKTRTSVAVALSYLLYFPMQAANLFDFHVESFLVAPILFAIYYLQTRQWKKLGVSVVVGLLAIEYSAFVIVAVGVVYLLLNIGGAARALRSKSFLDDRILVPLMLSLVGIGWFLGARQMMSFFNPAPPSSFEGAQNWSLIGAGSIAQIPVFAVLYPVNTLRAVAFDLPLKLAYVFLLLAPVFFVPILRPKALLAAIPWAAFAFVSNYAPYYQVGFQYPLFAVPGLFWALILALERMQSLNLTGKFLRISKSMPRILVASSLVGWIVFASIMYPMSLGGSMQHDDYLNEIINLVPPGATVLTQNNLFPHFSDRFTVYAIPISLPSWSSNYRAMVDLTFRKSPDFILVDGVTDSHAASVASLWLRANGGYGVYASSDGIILLKRSFDGAPKLYVPISWTLDESNLTMHGGRIVQDIGSATGAPVYRQANASDTSFWIAPPNPLVLPPGQYSVTLSLKTAAGLNGNILILNLRDANGTEQLSNFNVGGNATTISWTSFTYGFPLQHPESVWLNATSAAGAGDFYLDFIRVVQLSSGSGSSLQV